MTRVPASPIPPIYCINLPSSTDRRARMERRFAHHGVLERVRFVTAVTPGPGPDRWPERKHRAGSACSASHLGTMRMILADPGAVDGAIVCEDDVLLHNEFASRLAQVLDNLPGGCPLCSLGYLLGGWDPGLLWVGRQPDRGNLCPIVPGLCGAHMYWLSPAYAAEVLDRYGGLPLDELPTSTEALTQPAEGCISFPPLALQDVIESTIRPASDLEGVHLSGQPWPYAEYAACEEGDDASPLAHRPRAESPTIGLCMIVRDEAEVIERCVRSVRSLIASWTICDTGSTDGTPELVERLLAGVPGTLHRRSWQDFATNRSELMALASGTADYLLLLDADMTLERRGPLPALEADSYLLRHAGELDYAVPRLVRGDRRWRFVGSTHEYLATDGPHTEQVLEALLVHHHGDSGTREQKLDRDVNLLQGEIERDPRNERAIFYLAQTFRDRGEVERAIELYRRRVELGGWDEEVFYAAYQVGVLTALEDPDAAVPLLLDAFERRPSRAEPLDELARLSRNSGRHRSAYMFAKRGLEVPYPADRLFVHRHVYEWSLLFELSIAAYWSGEVEEALTANERLLEEGRLPQWLEETVRENRRYCLEALGKPVPGWRPGRRVERLDLLAPSLELAEIRLDVEPKWPQFNPTIAADGDGFRAVVRTANYNLERGTYRFLEEDPVVRTLNYLVRLDRSLEIEWVKPLVDEADGPAVYPGPVRGYEDCRLVQVAGHWYALAAVRDRNAEARCEVVLLALDDARIESVRVLAGPTPGRHEKNWMPLSVDERLRIVYSLAPTVVFDCDPATGRLREAANGVGPEIARSLRGGSQGVEVEDGWLFAVHEALDGAEGRTYVHRFVCLDRELRVSGVTPRFTFTGNSVELCAGLAPREGQLVMTFGVHDRVAGMAVCRTEEILAVLEPTGRSTAAAATD